jgi:hypothetical protein
LLRAHDSRVAYARWACSLVDSVHPPLPMPRWTAILYFVFPRGCDFIDFLVKSSSFERNCHPDRSEAKWRDLLFLLCPSNLTVPNKSHHPPLVIPKRTRISYFVALPTATYADLPKESRMKSTEATVFDRKSGAAEGSAVRPGSRTKVSVPLVLPQNRHPERSVGTCCLR